jgi:hypothetical protein
MPFAQPPKCKVEMEPQPLRIVVYNDLQAVSRFEVLE